MFIFFMFVSTEKFCFFYYLKYCDLCCFNLSKLFININFTLSLQHIQNNIFHSCENYLGSDCTIPAVVSDDLIMGDYTLIQKMSN